MLNKPCCGWSEIKVGSQSIGSASYLDPVPEMTLDAFIQYFGEENHLPFGITYDAEGYYFGLIEISKHLYYFNTTQMPVELEEITREWFPEKTEKELPDYSRAKEFLIVLAKEVVSDIKDNMDLWSVWYCFDESEQEEIQQEKEMLSRKVKLLEEIVGS